MLTRGLVVGAVAAVAAAQSAVLTFTNVPNPITDGQVQVLEYQTNDTTSPITITLRQGVSTALETLYNLTSSAPSSGSFVWTPRTDLPDGNDYALQISQGTQINYFGPFRVQGYLASSSSSVSSSGVSGSATVTPAPVGTAAASLSSSGIPASRNTTLSSATLSPSAGLGATTTTSSAPAGSSAATSSEGAGASASAQASSTTAASSSHTGGANANLRVGSSLALVGAIAAMLMP